MPFKTRENRPNFTSVRCTQGAPVSGKALNVAKNGGLWKECEIEVKIFITAHTQACTYEYVREQYVSRE